jgi:hypothetical protein
MLINNLLYREKSNYYGIRYNICKNKSFPKECKSSGIKIIWIFITMKKKKSSN